MNRKYKLYLGLLVAYLMNKAFNDPGDGEEPGMGWTEEQLAAAANLHSSTVYKLRTARTRDPKFKTIWKLCQVLGVEWSTVTEEMAEIYAGHA